MRHSFWIVLALLLFAACERNFDETTDTDQRFVEFTFDFSDMFSDVLVESADGFSLGDPSGLDDRHRVRLTARCYDDAGELVSKSETFTTLDGKPELKIRHLDRNRQYRFIFLADVVEYYTEDDYYETWYQLNDKTINKFYLAAFERNDTAKYNVVQRCTMTLLPDNQKVAVEWFPATYNGYLVFTNLESLNKLYGYTGCYQSWRVNSYSGMNVKGRYFERTNWSGNTVKVPVTASMADNFILVDIRKREGTAVDSIEGSIQTPSHRPFVTTVDCKGLSILNTEFF